MDRRSFLKAAGVGIAGTALNLSSASCKTSKQVEQEKWEDFKLQGLLYTKQIRQSVLNATLTPEEIKKVASALQDAPLIRDYVLGLIEDNRGHILDMVNQIVHMKRDTKGKRKPLKLEAEDVHSLIAKIPEKAQLLLESLASISPEACKMAEKDYEGAVKVYREKIQTWADQLAKTRLRIDLDEVQEHVDQYKNGMAIHYTPFRTPLEGFQALFSRVFDLYLQLCFRQKANVTWSLDTKKQGSELDSLMLDPNVKQLAIVGHGGWEMIDIGGTCAEPDKLIADIVMNYKKDPKGFMEMLQQIIKRVTIMLNRGSSDSFDFVFLQALISSQMGDTFNWKPGYYTNNRLDRLISKNGLTEKDPRRNKRIFRYTCGVSKYELSGPPVDKDGFLSDDILKYVPQEILNKVYFYGKGISAFKYKDVGQYEYEFAQALAKATKESELEKLYNAYHFICDKGPEPGCYPNANMALLKMDPQVVLNSLVGQIEKIKAQPLSDFWPVLKEFPEFASNYVLEPSYNTRGYEGLSYVPEFFGKPFMTRRGSADNFGYRGEEEVKPAK